MDSLMVVADYVESCRKTREDPGPTSDKLLSQHLWQSLGQESVPLDDFHATTSSTFTDSSPRWDAATVWNKALQVLKGTNQSLRLAGPWENGTQAVATNLSDSPSIDGEGAKGGAPPTHFTSVLLTDKHYCAYKEESCTLIGASCSRRATAQRSNSTEDPSTHCGSTHSVIHSRNSSSSPFHILRNAPLQGASSGSANEACTSPRCGLLLVGERGGTSMAIMCKAISGPLEKVGYLVKSKEKQE